MNVAGRAADLFSLHFDLQRSGAGINDRGAGDPNLRGDIAGVDVGIWHRGDSRAGIDETDLPQRRAVCARVGIGVEGIDTAVRGSDKNHVMRAFIRDRNVGETQWLRINLAVDRVTEKSSKSVAV